MLAGGRGINFAQNEFGDPVLPGSRLHGITEDLATWFPPQAAPYVFTIAGSIDTDASMIQLETQLQEAIDALASQPPTAEELATARRQLLDELVYDLETTEDAAHQLAYFAGLDALNVLLEMPGRLAAVAPADISRVAGAYLRPHQRTIGWYLAVQEAVAPPSPGAEAGIAEDEAPPASERVSQTAPAARSIAPSPPRVLRLTDGVPVIFQSNPLSSAAFLRVLLSSTQLEIEGAATPNSPVWRHTSLNFRFRPEALRATLAQAWDALGITTYAPPPSAASIEDPAARLAVAFDEVLGVSAPERTGISAIALVGDLRIEDVLPKLEEAFGDLTPASSDPLQPRTVPRNLEIELPVAKAQAQLGYVVAAPPPSDSDWFAWRMLLYVLSHGYEGRLGVEAISRRGLVYYIDAQYLSDGTSGRVSLAIGVDPAKLDTMRALLRETLQGLTDAPPTDVELAEAKSHLIGRRLSAAQSNEEVSAALIEEWVGRGRLLSRRGVRGGRERGFVSGSGTGHTHVRSGNDNYRQGGRVMRKTHLRKIGLVLGLLVSMALVIDCARTGEDSGRAPVDTAALIFSGGRILTLGEPAIVDAVAVGSGRILAIGDRAAVEKFRGPATVDYDLSDRVLAPAFVDHHVHLLNLGFSLLYRAEPSPTFVDLAGLDSLEKIGDRVETSTSVLPDGTWILGQSWSQGAWGASELPTHEVLSTAAPDHPVFFTRGDGHAGWANHEALAAAGIDAATPDPPGGVIRRAPDGSPSGVLLERANELLATIVARALAGRDPSRLSAGGRCAVGAGRHRGLRRRFSRAARCGRSEPRLRAIPDAPGGSRPRVSVAVAHPPDGPGAELPVLAHRRRPVTLSAADAAHRRHPRQALH